MGKILDSREDVQEYLRRQHESRLNKTIRYVKSLSNDEFSEWADFFLVFTLIGLGLLLVRYGHPFVGIIIFVGGIRLSRKKH